MIQKKLNSVREKSEQFGFWVKQSIKWLLNNIWNVFVLIGGGIGMFFLGFIMGIVRIDEKKEETKKEVK